MRVETYDNPPIAALLLDEVRDHLRIPDDSEDASLGALTAAAESLIETYLGVALVDREVAIYLSCWPGCTVAQDWWQGVREGAMTTLGPDTTGTALPVRPVSEITKVETLGPNATWAVVPSSRYGLVPGLEPRFYATTAGTWPQPSRMADGIRITAVAGFGPDWNSVPPAIRRALLMLIAHLYVHRGDEAEGSLDASGVLPFLSPYRRKRL